MSEKQPLNNKELDSAHGGLKFTAEKTDVEHIDLTNSINKTYGVFKTEKSDVPFFYQNKDAYYANDKDRTNSMDDLFAKEKKGISGMIESFIESLKKLFNF